MEINISESGKELGKAAAKKGAEIINRTIHRKGRANIILATGSSQFEMLKELTRLKIDWSGVTAFHLDEYIGIPVSHPASFRRYLKERFVDLVSPGIFHYIDGEGSPSEECARLGDLIGQHPIDLAYIGIGENGHLAFNDPPADFNTENPFMEVELDLACRKQQLGEGWFASIEEVPARAISMSIKQILKSDSIICSVPDARKATAVKGTVEGPVSPDVPASVLNRHEKTWLYLDRESSSLLHPATK